MYRQLTRVPQDPPGAYDYGFYSDEDDDDRAFYSDEDDEDDCHASSKTLGSSTQAYRYENGRRYHAYRDGAYWGPNDETDSYHQALVDRLFLAPLENPRNILDIGTGRGLWAMDVSDQYPDSEVIGTDLSPVWDPPVQPNLRFEVDDCCSEWAYPPNFREKLDLIHIRGLYGSVQNWNKLYQECFETMKQDIINAGFVDVVERKFKVPLGAWSSDPRQRDIGRVYQKSREVGMEGWFLAPATRLLGWSVEEAKAFIEKTCKITNDDSNRVYFETTYVYGRKPREDEPTTSTQ
ncbi:uncharacterized protein GIQ15_06064 [Arthroderma uncinatum]|uniref:uncharacterized protein n=1 Tax=Arthroderma uncinatum TaxID=74035 RepID=UPI00144A557D|nr:uncharacterized protein GIQ15_06064 [Arthroderma uncinatum]KAF3480717.1 hypothetical protein GIQ15_06064 [Arthroderma uncinatum]